MKLRFGTRIIYNSCDLKSGQQGGNLQLMRSEEKPMWHRRHDGTMENNTWSPCYPTWSSHTEFIMIKTSLRDNQWHRGEDGGMRVISRHDGVKGAGPGVYLIWPQCIRPGHILQTSSLGLGRQAGTWRWPEVIIPWWHDHVITWHVS